MFDESAANDNGPWFLACGGDASAGRTGVSVGYVLGLSIQKFFEGAACEGLGGLGSAILHVIEIDIESGSVGSEGAIGNDFAELLRDEPEGSQIVGGQAASCHDQTFTGVVENKRVKMTRG